MITLERAELQDLLEQAAERGAMRALSRVERPSRYVSGAEAARLLGLSYYDFRRRHVLANNIWPVQGKRFARKDVLRLRDELKRREENG